MTEDKQMAFNLCVSDVYTVDWVYAARRTKEWASFNKGSLPPPPPSFVREIMRLDPETGILYWKHRKDMRINWNNAWANKKITPSNVNMVGMTYNGQYYRTVYHRVVWCHYYGEWPDSNLVVDHINGDHYDNRIKNLRCVTHSENAKNRKRPDNNKSGHQGVIWYKQYEKWKASIINNGKYVFLGYFINKEDAIKARKAAERKYGFHENHGRVGKEDERRLMARRSMDGVYKKD